MEIAIISNICGNRHALDAFLNQIAKDHQVEVIINLGNFLEIGPNPHDVAKKIISDSRFINILSHKDIKILNRVPSIGAHLTYFSYYDWALYQLGLSLANKLKEFPTEYIFKSRNKSIIKVLASYSFPHDISSNPDYIVFGDYSKSFTGDFHGIKVICPGILGYSKDGTMSYAILESSNNEIELYNIKYNNANLFTDYKKSRIPEKKEIIRTFHKG